MALETIYNPKLGFITFVQTKNAARFSAYDTPFSNLINTQITEFLRHIKNIEPGALVAKEYGSEECYALDEYLDYLSQKSDQWEIANIPGLGPFSR